MTTVCLLGAWSQQMQQRPGSSKSVTLVLKPGHYVLICNLAGHYQAGMHAAFIVR